MDIKITRSYQNLNNKYYDDVQAFVKL